jgi:hypothetical protein
MKYNEQKLDLLISRLQMQPEKERLFEAGADYSTLAKAIYETFHPKKGVLPKYFYKKHKQQISALTKFEFFCNYYGINTAEDYTYKMLGDSAGISNNAVRLKIDKYHEFMPIMENQIFYMHLDFGKDLLKKSSRVKREIYLRALDMIMQKQ